MVVALRLARYALSRNNPGYHIVAINSTLRIRARPIEILGSYSPLPTLTAPVSMSPNGQVRGREWGASQAESVKGKMQKVGEKSVDWNEHRVRYWLTQGAVPSKRVEKLLISAGVLGQSLF